MSNRRYGRLATCATEQPFMESLLSFFYVHRGHEPEWAERSPAVPPAPRARQRERDDRSAVDFASGAGGTPALLRLAAGHAHEHLFQADFLFFEADQLKT